MDSGWWKLAAVAVGLLLGAISIARLRGRAGRDELDRDPSLPVTSFKKYSDMSASSEWFRDTGLLVAVAGVVFVAFGGAWVGLLVLGLASVSLLMARRQRRWLRGHRVPAPEPEASGEAET